MRLDDIQEVRVHMPPCSNVHMVSNKINMYIVLLLEPSWHSDIVSNYTHDRCGFGGVVDYFYFLALAR